jgi:hypothetical protein
MPTNADSQAGVNGNNPSTSRWLEMALLTEARGTVRAVEFAPHHFGLKLVRFECCASRFLITTLIVFVGCGVVR